QRCLLRRQLLQRPLGVFAPGDVVEHPVPDGDAALVKPELGVIHDPDDFPIAGKHAVVDRRVTIPGTVFGALKRKGSVAIVRVEPLRPERWIGQPLFWPVPEYLLDAWADIAPRRLRAHLGYVHDRRHLLDQGAETCLRG